MIRVDAVWLASEPLDMRAGSDTALALTFLGLCRLYAGQRGMLPSFKLKPGMAMKLNHFKFWGNDTTETAGSATAQAQGGSEPFSNVIQHPAAFPLDQAAGLSMDEADPMAGALAPKDAGRTPQGPMGAPQFTAFFAQNYFGLGRHNGAHYKTHAALEQGKAMVVSRFQNVASVVIDQKQAKIDSLRNVELQTEGVCATTSSRLRLACTRLERDIATLQHQIDLASEGKGWVLASLNEYQIGFSKGTREAIEAELLGL